MENNICVCVCVLHLKKQWYHVNKHVCNNMILLCRNLFFTLTFNTVDTLNTVLRIWKITSYCVFKGLKS